MNNKNYFVYILGNVNRKVLYIGVTNDLSRRLFEHHHSPQGFVKKYKVHDLLYFEHTTGVYGAIEREKELKSWRRQKKIALIFEKNPNLVTIKI